MSFAEFNTEMSAHIKAILKNSPPLFTTDVDKDLLWSTYLDSFPPGTNEIFRERREFDCNRCKRFIRAFGNVVTVVDNKLVSIWDFKPSQAKFRPVVKALAKLVKSANIKDVFITKESRFGAGCTWGKRFGASTIKFYTWDHFFFELPSNMVTPHSASEGSLMSEKRDTKNVFQRSLDELSQDSIDTVLDLIAQKSLYRGEEWQSTLSRFRDLTIEYKKLPASKRDNYCWAKSVEVGLVIGRIRNHSIGVLLQDISSGMDLDEAVRRYERIVAPTNYKRPKTVFTKRMVEQAQETVTELGLFSSLPRRHATLDDISINDILFANRDAAKRMTGDVFSSLKQETAVNPKKLGKTEEVPIEHFLEQILPNVNSMEVLMENRHISNLVSLIAPQNPKSKSMFKWGNNFSWAYNGNITDSTKERVKVAGGNVDGVLRFSIRWNDNDDNLDDLDAHCIEPGGNHICFRNKRNYETTSILDVDIIHPRGTAVENITWTRLQDMEEGEYRFYVHCYASRRAKSGFSAEIEYDGQIYSYEYARPLRSDEKVTVAKINFSRRKGIEFVESLSSTTSSKEVWGLSTNQFTPVSVLMRSPNYWEGQNGIGHQHYFFMLKGCENEDSPNGFFNEFLREDLMKHKRVFEALGEKMRVQPSSDQLSGIGFSSTKRNSVICKVSGSFTRTLNITF